ncbi:hypothetical protein [Xanthomonas sp. 4461]|uniref:hypothetical protein n=1 Tax=Xanthomonas sp. 4461 TaxID=3035313 RepID=UPI0021677E90|nr:hypothetical protein [Xanthomonas sp. 4461]MCS3807854.1 hypothetical protein [Xanthomonas sp. 4461]
MNEQFGNSGQLQSAVARMERGYVAGIDEEWRDDLRVVLDALHTRQLVDRGFVDLLVSVINDVQNELGFTDEEKECSNGSAEIVIAIRELKDAARQPVGQEPFGHIFRVVSSDPDSQSAQREWSGPGCVFKFGPAPAESAQLPLRSQIQYLDLYTAPPPPAAVPVDDEGWSGWATQYPGKAPVLRGAREIAELNYYPEEGQRLLFLTSATPPAPAAVPVELETIGELIRTQNNRSTDAPIFIVQQKRMYAADPECDHDRMVWVDGDGEACAEDAARLDAEFAETGETPDGWRRAAEAHYWDFVTACFTEQGCKDFIARDGHNLCEPRIYAAGSYRNSEWRQVRSFLADLATHPQPAAAKEQRNG